MSASAEFQKLLIDTMLADPTLSGMVGAHVYDEIPSVRPPLCIAIGASDFRPDDLDCLTAREETMQIDVYDRRIGGKVGARRVVDAIFDLFHDADLALPDPYALALIRVELVRVFRDPDGVTKRGVVQVTGEIETA